MRYGFQATCIDYAPDGVSTSPTAIPVVPGTLVYKAYTTVVLEDTVVVK